MEREGERPPPVPGEFRELALEKFKFEMPGTYRIRAVYHDYIPKLLDEKTIKRRIEKGLSRENQMEMYREDMENSLKDVESDSAEIVVFP